MHVVFTRKNKRLSRVYDRKSTPSYTVRWNMRSAECGVRSAECGVRSAECGVRSVENEECRKCGVWKMRSVENAECRKCGV